MALTKAHNRMIEGSPVNVKDFGAVGDNVTDDTAAIQAALDAADGTFTVYFPYGTYKITSPLQIKGSMRLSGEFSTITKSTNTVGNLGSMTENGETVSLNVDAILIMGEDDGSHSLNFMIEGLRFTSSSSSAYGLFLPFVARGTIRDVFVSGVDTCLYGRNIFSCTFDRLWLQPNKVAGSRGIDIDGSGTSSGGAGTSNSFTSLVVNGGEKGIFFDGMNTTSISGYRAAQINDNGSNTAIGTSGAVMEFEVCDGISVTGAGNEESYVKNDGGIIKIKNSKVSIEGYVDQGSTLEATSNLVFMEGSSISQLEFNGTLGRSITVGAFIYNKFVANSASLGGTDYYIVNTGGEYDVSTNVLEIDDTNDKLTVNGDLIIDKLNANLQFDNGSGVEKGNIGMSGGAMQLASDTTIELYSDGAPLSGGSLALTVNQSGSINFEPLSSDPSSPSAGDVYYNSTTNKLRCYNGTSWNDLF